MDSSSAQPSRAASLDKPAPANHRDKTRRSTTCGDRGPAHRQPHGSEHTLDRPSVARAQPPKTQAAIAKCGAGFGDDANAGAPIA